MGPSHVVIARTGVHGLSPVQISKNADKSEAINAIAMNAKAQKAATPPATTTNNARSIEVQGLGG